MTGLDDEGTKLVLVVPAQVTEGEGTRVGAGVVQIPGTLPYDLVLPLASTDPSRVRLPLEGVRLPAGQTTATFDLTMPENASTDGAQSVRISVSAPGFLGATQTMAVLDNDVHHFGLSFIPTPQFTGAMFRVTVTAYDPVGN